MRGYPEINASQACQTVVFRIEINAGAVPAKPRDHAVPVADSVLLKKFVPRKVKEKVIRAGRPPL
jgi:hypothetical protein